MEPPRTAVPPWRRLLLDELRDDQHKRPMPPVLHRPLRTSHGAGALRSHVQHGSELLRKAAAPVSIVASQHPSHAHGLRRLASSVRENLTRGASLADAFRGAADAVPDFPAVREAARSIAGRISDGIHPSTAAHENRCVLTMPFVELLILGQASIDAFLEVERVFGRLAEVGRRDALTCGSSVDSSIAEAHFLSLLVTMQGLHTLGSPLTDAMRVAATVAPNDVAVWVTSVADDLDAGRALDAALDRAGAAPESVRELLTGGCRRGTLIDDLDDWITRRLSRGR